MKRNMKVMMVLIGMALLFSSSAIAAPERGTPTHVNLSAGDIDYDFTPAPGTTPRLSLTERLSLQSAVCALWHNSMKQNPDVVTNLDPMTLEGPEHIFVDPSSNVYFENGEWIFNENGIKGRIELGKKYVWLVIEESTDSRFAVGYHCLEKYGPASFIEPFEW